MQNTPILLASKPARLSGGLAVRALALTYLSVMLIIPLAVIFYDGLSAGLGGMVRAILRPVAWHALTLSLWTAGVMAVINAVMGTLTA
jgi:ABC-type sulfate transport system permease subunit